MSTPQFGKLLISSGQRKTQVTTRVETRTGATSSTNNWRTSGGIRETCSENSVVIYLVSVWFIVLLLPEFEATLISVDW